MMFSGRNSIGKKGKITVFRVSMHVGGYIKLLPVESKVRHDLLTDRKFQVSKSDIFCARYYQKLVKKIAKTAKYSIFSLNL